MTAASRILAKKEILKTESNHPYSIRISKNSTHYQLKNPNPHNSTELNIENSQTEMEIKSKNPSKIENSSKTTFHHSKYTKRVVESSIINDEDSKNGNDNISDIKRTKINNIKIITKRKEQNKNINSLINNNNNILDLNKQINSSNDISKGNLTKHDLKGEIVNNYTDYLNQGLDDTTTNNQYDKSQPSMIYNHKSITKNKFDTRLHLDKNEIEEEIVTEVKPKVYGIATKTVARKYNLDEDE